MPKLDRIKKVSNKKANDNKQDNPVQTISEPNDDLLKYTDELLDEIDELIAPVGIDFVKDFVQAGGQ